MEIVSPSFHGALSLSLPWRARPRGGEQVTLVLSEGHRDTGNRDQHRQKMSCVTVMNPHWSEGKHIFLEKERGCSDILPHGAKNILNLQVCYILARNGEFEIQMTIQWMSNVSPSRSQPKEQGSA